MNVRNCSLFPVWHLLLRTVTLKVKGLFVASRPRKVHEHLKTPDLRLVLPRNKWIRIMGRRI